jgi:hypothetical protein
MVVEKRANERNDGLSIDTQSIKKGPLARSEVIPHSELATTRHAR